MNKERILDWLIETVKLAAPMGQGVMPLAWGNRPVYPTKRFDIKGDKCLVLLEEKGEFHVIRAVEPDRHGINSFRWRELNKRLSDLIVLALWEKL